MGRYYGYHATYQATDVSPNNEEQAQQTHFNKEKIDDREKGTKKDKQ